MGVDESRRGREREEGGKGRWTVGVSLGSESVRAGRAKGGLLGGGGGFDRLGIPLLNFKKKSRWILRSFSFRMEKMMETGRGEGSEGVSE